MSENNELLTAIAFFIGLREHAREEMSYHGATLSDSAARSFNAALTALEEKAQRCQPLPLGKAIGTRPVWCEYREETRASRNGWKTSGMWIAHEHNAHGQKYGVTFRCWLEEPTAEQRAAAEWEDMEQ